MQAVGVGLLVIVLTMAFPLEGDKRSRTITWQGLTDDQADVVEWAVGRFERAGLDLPAVRFVGHAGTDRCAGRAGIAHRHAEHTEIGICTAEAGFVEQWLFLHELAHAWDHHRLDDRVRGAFMELRGLGTWRSPKVEWHHRAAEHAAEIVVWGLIDRPVRLVRIPDNDCDALLTGYWILTGTAPLRRSSDHCARSDLRRDR